jgi:hypothetical protein
MKIAKLLLPLPLAAMALTAGHALAQDSQNKSAATESEASGDASINFVNHGGVWDWHADSKDVVYFQDRQHQWYRAELMMPAVELPFVHYIGIDGGAVDRLDKWGAIYVEGRRYPFRSFEKVPGDKPWKEEAAAAKSE